MKDSDGKITVRAYGTAKQFDRGASLGEIARQFQEYEQYPILLARTGSRLRELGRSLRDDSDVTFLTMRDKAGHDTYARSLVLMMLKAFTNVIRGEEEIHIWVRFAVSQGLFCTFSGEQMQLSQELLDQVKAEMGRLVDMKIPFEKRSVSTSYARKLFQKSRMYDKAKLFRYRITSRTNVYSFAGYTDYNYGYMVKDSSYLRIFDLRLYKDGFVLMMPTMQEPDRLPEFSPVEKLFEVQNDSRRWGEMMHIDTVGDLNDLVAQGKTKELILAQEAYQEKRIAEIAQMIADQPGKRLVMVAGPSSSSKTTFSHRLSIQLSVHGLTPHPVPMDDYFKNREDTPRDEKGNYDFECLEAIDVDLFNKDMTGLLEGEDVQLPSFNFKTGQREYKGDHLQLGDRDILVIEGIHGLDDRLTVSLPKESMFRIYISALTQLNIDEHNRIPTTDGRLIRRIIRDQRTRGTSAKNTIAMWDSVRRGEENYIFPFQESADVMFNSALIYELAVLKIYAEPMLFAVGEDDPEYTEAKRLLKFLDYFLPIPADDIPKNSLVREFIGGGTFLA